MQTMKRIKADKVTIHRSDRLVDSSIIITLIKEGDNGRIRSVHLSDEVAKDLADTLEVDYVYHGYVYNGTLKATHFKDYITLEISVDYHEDSLYMDLNMEAYSELTAEIEALF